tara:strand:+ start:325 stop:942 length:618 start_codon:yes stop_codon:yes gene_type:complete
MGQCLKDMTAENKKIPIRKRRGNNVPTEWVSGDTIIWDTQVPDYPATDGWTLSYILKSQNAHIASFNASADGADYTVTITASTSDGYTAGEYHYQAFVTKGAERFIVDNGKVTIKKNFADSGNYDDRTHAKIVLDAIESVIEGRATKDQESYSIAGRSLERTPIPQLLVLRDRYRAEVVREDRADRIRRGLGHSGRIKTRFSGLS